MDILKSNFSSNPPSGPTLANNISNSVAMYIFGGVDRGALPRFFTNEERNYWEFLYHKYSLTEICLINLNSFKFVSNAVGTTGNAKRMGEIVSFLKITIQLIP
jgi:hypothetical protein